MSKHCHECGHKVEDHHKHCNNCGTKLDHTHSSNHQKTTEKPPIDKKIILLGLGAIVLILIVYSLSSDKTQYPDRALSSDSTALSRFANSKESCPYQCCEEGSNFEVRVCQGNYVCQSNKCVLPDCPYECCADAAYQEKSCSSDYECNSHRCVAKDSDNDGLTDIEEKQVGTNPLLVDTDGDTLSDYTEVKISHTNPLKVNTDGDRYTDNTDSDPLIKNTANVEVSITSKEFGIDWINIAIALSGIGVLNPDMVIATPKVTLAIANRGNDYASYLNYNIVFYVANTELSTFPVTKGRVNQGTQVTDTQSFEIKAKQVPNILLNVITQKSSAWAVSVENIDYEKF